MAATVTISTVDILSVATSVTIEFIPQSFPAASGSNIVLDNRYQVTTASDGTASLTLEEGVYDVRFLNLSGRGELTVQVPSSGTVTLASIITSTSPGFFSQLPRITSTQRDALTAKNGMMIYNTTTNRVEKYEASAWLATSAGSGGAGDVTGPASAVDANIALFDGTTGKLIKDSGSALSDFASASHTHATSDVTSGTFVDARIAESNVTQHEAALTITKSQVSDLTIGSAELAADAVTGQTEDLSPATGDFILSYDVDGVALKKVQIGNLPTGGSGTVTSVALSVPTGLTVAGSPITSSGTLAVSLQSGYSIPTDANQTNWTTAYGWGDHASAGYITDITGEAVGSLLDVNITSVVNGEVLVYNAGNWINQTLAESGISAVGHTHAASDITSGTFADARVAESNVTQHQGALSITESQISDLQSYLTVVGIGDIQDFNFSLLTNGDLMMYDSGNNWWYNISTADAGLVTDSGTTTFTNKTFDANASGNSITNIETEDIASGSKSGSDATLITGTAGSTDRLLSWDANGDAVDAGVSKSAASTGAVIVTFGDGSTAISTGAQQWVEMPYSGTITGWTALADVSGSITVDVWKDTYANYPPTDADSITASAQIAISAATKASDATLAGWTTSVSAGDILLFNVDSASTLTKVVITLDLTKS